MTSEERALRVREIVASIAKIEKPDEIQDESDVYRDLGIKSVNALDLLLSLEETFDIAISDEDFGDARTVGLLDSLVGSLT